MLSTGSVSSRKVRSFFTIPRNGRRNRNNFRNVAASLGSCKPNLSMNDSLFNHSNSYLPTNQPLLTTSHPFLFQDPFADIEINGGVPVHGRVLPRPHCADDSLYWPIQFLPTPLPTRVSFHCSLPLKPPRGPRRRLDGRLPPRPDVSADRSASFRL